MKGLRLLTLLLVVNSYAAFSQKGFEEGYVITLDNDTIHGKIKDYTSEESKIGIKFIDAKGEKVKYKAKNTKGYYKSGGKHYWSVKSGLTVFFGEVLVDGPLKLIKVATPPVTSPGTTSGAPTNADISKSMQEERLNDAMLKIKHFIYNSKSEEVITVKLVSFRSQMRALLANNAQLKAQIGSKGYRYDDLETIVEKQNEFLMR